MQQQLTTEVLMGIWDRTLGKTPPAAQFEIWAVLHTPEVIKEAIVATAKKNLSLNDTMSEEYRIRFASDVMNVRSRRRVENAANRAALAAGRKGEAAGEDPTLAESDGQVGMQG